MNENKRSWGILVLLIVNPLIIILYSDATFDSSSLSPSTSLSELLESAAPPGELAPFELGRPSPAESLSKVPTEDPEAEASLVLEPREVLLEPTRRSPGSRSRAWQ